MGTIRKLTTKETEKVAGGMEESRGRVRDRNWTSVPCKNCGGKIRVNMYSKENPPLYCSNCEVARESHNEDDEAKLFHCRECGLDFWKYQNPNKAFRCAVNSCGTCGSENLHCYDLGDLLKYKTGREN